MRTPILGGDAVIQSVRTRQHSPRVPDVYVKYIPGRRLPERAVREVLQHDVSWLRVDVPAGRRRLQQRDVSGVSDHVQV